MSKATYHVPQPGEMITFEGFPIPVTVKSWDSKHGILTIQNGGKLHVKNRSSINLAEPVKKPVPEKKAEEFKVGDRVVAIENFGGAKIKGKRGTIKGFHNNPIYAAVEYDQNIDEGHSCEGLTHKERGWWTALEKLRHLTPEELAEEAKFAEHPEKEESCAEAGDELRLVDSSADEPVVVAAAFTARLPTSFASEVERAQAIADAEAEEKNRSEAANAEWDRLGDEIEVLVRRRRDLMEANGDAEEDHKHRVTYLRSLRVRGE